MSLNVLLLAFLYSDLRPYNTSADENRLATVTRLASSTTTSLELHRGVGAWCLYWLVQDKLERELKQIKNEIKQGG